MAESMFFQCAAMIVNREARYDFSWVNSSSAPTVTSTSFQKSISQYASMDSFIFYFLGDCLFKVSLKNVIRVWRCPSCIIFWAECTLFINFIFFKNVPFILRKSDCLDEFVGMYQSVKVRKWSRGVRMGSGEEWLEEREIWGWRCSPSSIHHLNV